MTSARPRARKIRTTNPENGLGEACIAAALEIIEARGIESLSLREVARVLGVSHQAPYKHFASRDHIVAEIVRREYEAFVRYLESAADITTPHRHLASMGSAYLRFAALYPKRYQLMFEIALPNCDDHPGLATGARRAFDLLRDRLAALPSHKRATRERIEHDAVFIWSALHGMASLLRVGALPVASIDASIPDLLGRHLLQRIGIAIER